jgi:hypothetical protein
MRSVLLILAVAAAFASPVAAQDSTVPTETLIDQLTQLDAEAPGIDALARYESFFAEDRAPRFTGGLTGTAVLATMPQMRELTRRGLSALPALLAHLDDARPTRLVVTGVTEPNANTPQGQHVTNGPVPFAAEFYTGEYDARVRTIPRFKCDGVCTSPDKAFSGSYTVKVGDVCFALVGQIVDRNLAVLRYHSGGILAVNSPVQDPALAARARQDWSGLTADAHKAQLLDDLHNAADERETYPALARLRYYYPDAYAALSGADANTRAAFEADEKKPPVKL